MTTALAASTRQMVEGALAPHDPELAQFQMSVKEYAAAARSKLKWTLIRDPEWRRHPQALVVEAGCDADQTLVEVLRLRTPMSNGYRATKMACVFHAHRDIWHSAPGAVRRADVASCGGAEKVYSYCTATTLQDYLEVVDPQRVPKDMARGYDDDLRVTVVDRQVDPPR